MLLAPVKKELQRFRTAYLTARTRADGTFQLVGDPGEYFLFARQRGDLPAIITEDYVRIEGAKAPRVNLTAGETSRRDIKVPEPPPNSDVPLSQSFSCAQVST